MKKFTTYAFAFMVLAGALISNNANAQVMSDYTAYPPFVTSAVEPNVLLVLDHSGSMQFPAYSSCSFSGYSSGRAKCGTTDSLSSPEFGYDVTRDYYGYFKTDKYYQYSSNKFVENAGCSFTPADPGYKIGNNAGCISGNIMNWATMSRIDLLRKALIGGKSISQQSNAHTLRGEGGWWTYTDHSLGCSFTITGGSYPQLNHTVSIANTGATGSCGNLAVWANGTSIWGTSDQFRYVYQSVSGNFDATLRIVTPPTETGQTFAKAGLMVRTSTNANSQHVKAMATFGSGLQFSDRLTNGGGTNLVGAYVPSTYPAWVRIVRSGNTFTYYYSGDGTTWTLHGSSVVSMPSAVLIGMATSSYSNGVLGKGEYDQFTCNACSNDDFNDGFFNTSIWNSLDINTSIAGNQLENCSGSCAVGTLSTSNIKVDLPEKDRKGVIQSVSDKDGDGNFDPGAPRFGLMSYASNSRYGCMRVGIDGSNMSSLMNALQSEVPYYGTPTGEALNEAWDYFRQVNSHSGCNNNAFIGGQGSSKDPWYDTAPVPCRKSFVLLISDGEWNGSVDPVRPARETHINDIRSDLAGNQTLKHFTIYTFGDAPAGVNSMQQTAMYGAFEDYDNNKWPYNRSGYPSDSRSVALPSIPCVPGSTDTNCEEWDKNKDGLPDTYYEASKGNKLEAAIANAIGDMLKQSSSGTSVSVLATTGEGEGSVYQAYFFPERPKKEGSFETRKWLGYLHAFFVDSKGNLRENNSNPGYAALDDNDNIIMMDSTPDEGTRVFKCSYDTNGNVNCPSTPDPGGLDSIMPVWNGGDKLWRTPPSQRRILTTLTGYDYSGLDYANEPTKGTFVSDMSSSYNALALQPYLRAADPDEAHNIINWIRGDDLTGVVDSGHVDGYRLRDITKNGITDVWKLGDIVYSTPTVVAKPMENYDLLYGDATYTSFRLANRNRRHVVYVGSNDGMLHAFNAGCYDSATHSYYPDVDSSGNCSSGAHTLGQELWGFIPRGILPHLKWNTMPDYTHVYQVDLKPKVTDIKVFNAGGKHTKGWGTILIGGLRYGGKTITCPAPCNSMSPEYYALDITDPLNPRPLWSFTDPELGLSMSYPAIAKIGNRWFAVFGSGATDYNTGSDLLAYQKGNLFVLDLSSGSDGVITSWTLNSNYWKIPTGNTTSFLSHPITIDVDLDYNVDVLYVGENYQQGTNWNGLMRRITTGNGSQASPAAWSLSTLGNISSISSNKDAVKRITAAPSAAVDDRSHLWVFFGTGQFYGVSDKNHSDTGAFYGIKDGCWKGNCSSSYSSLLDVSQAVVKTDGSVSGVGGSCGAGSSTWAQLLSSSSSCDGWAMYFGNVIENADFEDSSVKINHPGERMLAKPLVLGGLVTWATYIPGVDECEIEGESNIYAVYYKTGTAYKKYIFTEQKEDPSDSTPKTVARVRKLGAGMPSSVSAQVTASGTTKGFVQSQNGSILEIETDSPMSLTSGVKGWMSERIQ